MMFTVMDKLTQTNLEFHMIWIVNHYNAGWLENLEECVEE